MNTGDFKSRSNTLNNSSLNIPNWRLIFLTSVIELNSAAELSNSFRLCSRISTPIGLGVEYRASGDS